MFNSYSIHVLSTSIPKSWCSADPLRTPDGSLAEFIQVWSEKGGSPWNNHYISASVHQSSSTSLPVESLWVKPPFLQVQHPHFCIHCMGVSFNIRKCVVITPQQNRCLFVSWGKWMKFLSFPPSKFGALFLCFPNISRSQWSQTAPKWGILWANRITLSGNRDLPRICPS